MITIKEIEDNFNNLTDLEKQHIFQWLTPELAVVIDKCIPGIPFIKEVADNISNSKNG
jgi:hypothetical protein